MKQSKHTENKGPTYFSPYLNHCRRCAHEWFPRKTAPAQRCPRCQFPNWQEKIGMDTEGEEDQMEQDRRRAPFIGEVAMYRITNGEHTYRVARLDAEAGVVKPGGHFSEGDFVPGIHWKYNYRNDNETEDIVWNTVYSGPCQVETLR